MTDIPTTVRRLQVESAWHYSEASVYRDLAARAHASSQSRALDTAAAIISQKVAAGLSQAARSLMVITELS